jgi:hypothetical protein
MHRMAICSGLTLWGYSLFRRWELVVTGRKVCMVLIVVMLEAWGAGVQALAAMLMIQVRCTAFTVCLQCVGAVISDTRPFVCGSGPGFHGGPRAARAFRLRRPGPARDRLPLLLLRLPAGRHGESCTPSQIYQISCTLWVYQWGEAVIFAAQIFWTQEVATRESAPSEDGTAAVSDHSDLASWVLTLGISFLNVTVFVRVLQRVLVRQVPPN